MKTHNNFPVAVVGMHGRFPNALDVKEFWENLTEGNDPVSTIPSERWNWKEIYGAPENNNVKTHINCGAFTSYVDRFDYRYFNILPREAESMDPQQRLFLQTAYSALEDAGYAPDSLSGKKVGVFVGIGPADYPLLLREDNADFNIYRATGISLTCIANRLSFSLDVHGPSESIDTACSGSLIAMHRAIQSMQSGECELAIVGGVNLLLAPELFIGFDKAGMLSKSGHCRTFDINANGYVRGEGVAALVLRPLNVAENNKDYIYGVIQSTAENHGGRAHSFTAPNKNAQAELIKDAWKKSGYSFNQACSIETHGTGTPLGDPIEVNALKKVFSDEVDDEKTGNKIALGALKSHVGHLEATAGIGGVIKLLLSMKHRVIPANLHHKELNPHINIDNTPFYVPTENTDLDELYDKDKVLLGGVSSFAFGGVNAHAVIRSYENKINDETNKNKPKSTGNYYLVPLSAKDEAGLIVRARQLAQFLKESNEGEESLINDEKIASILRSALQKEDIELSGTSSISIASLKLSANKWLRVLKEVSKKAGLEINIGQLRDCVTLTELSKRIVKLYRSSIIVSNLNNASVMSPRVAIQTNELKSVTLEQIVYTLMHGRDVMKERLVILTQSKSELFQLLQKFLQAPEKNNSKILRASKDNKEIIIKKPGKITDLSNTTELENLANYWLETKKAVLTWEDIYPEINSPSKFPLPSYPFNLSHCWYKSNIKHEPEKISKAVINAQVDPVDIASIWKDCWLKSNKPMPASLSSIAYLLDYAANKGIKSFSDIVIGRPCDIKNEQVSFTEALVSQSKLLQCVALLSDSQVLLQAKQNSIANASSRTLSTWQQQTESMSLDSFYSFFKEIGLDVDPKYQSIKHVAISSNQLVLDLTSKSSQVAPNVFFTSLIIASLTSILFLKNKILDSSLLFLPWKIDSISFNPKEVKTATKLYLSLDDDENKMSLFITNSNDLTLLSMEGITLRQLPNLILVDTNKNQQIHSSEDILMEKVI
jgi:3-oxoacyl-(acyl-carrier-protein) synthase